MMIGEDKPYIKFTLILTYFLLIYTCRLKIGFRKQDISQLIVYKNVHFPWEKENLVKLCHPHNV